MRIPPWVMSISAPADDGDLGFIFSHISTFQTRSIPEPRCMFSLPPRPA